MRVTTAAAVALHALALTVVATRQPLSRPLAPAIAEPELLPIELAEPAPVPEPPRLEGPVTPAPGAVAASRPRSARLAARAPDPGPTASTATGAGASDEAAAGAPGIGAPSATALAAAGPPDALPPPLLPRATPAPFAALAGPLATGYGLRTSTEVMAAVQRVAQGPAAPANGHGLLRVTVDADGTVSGVSSTSASWAGMVSALRAAFAGRRFRAPGGHGVVLAFACDAYVTSAPAVLTGEKRAEPSSSIGPQGGGMSIDKAPIMAVIDYKALLPGPRRVVKVELTGEEPR